MMIYFAVKITLGHFAKNVNMIKTVVLYLAKINMNNVFNVKIQIFSIY